MHCPCLNFFRSDTATGVSSDIAGSFHGDGDVSGIVYFYSSFVGWKGIPPTWIMYMIVEDLEGGLEKCVELGGLISVGPKDLGPYHVSVFSDPVEPTVYCLNKRIRRISD